jgi:hypothetical protein
MINNSFPAVAPRLIAMTDQVVGPEAVRHKYRALFEAIKGTNLADSLIIARDLGGVCDHV